MGDPEHDGDIFNDFGDCMMPPDIQDAFNTMLMSSSSKQNNESLLMDYMNNEYDIITINPNIDYESDRSSNASPSRSRSSSVGSVIFENEDMDLEPPMTGLGGYSSDSSSSSSSSSDSSSSSESDDEEISQIEDVSKMAKPEIKISMDVKMKSALPARIECNTQIVQEIVKTKEIEQNNNIILQPKIKILPIELIKKEDVLTKLLSGNVNKSSNKVYSSPGELTVDLTCDNLTGVKSPAPEKKTKKLNLQEYKKRRVGTQIPRDDTESNTKRCQLQLDLANMPTSLPDILLPNLDGSINPLMIKKKEPVPLSPCHNPDYEEVTTISIGCNTEVTIKPDTVEAEDEDTSPSFKNIVNILKQDNKHGLLKSQNSLLSSIHNVVIQKAKIAKAKGLSARNNENLPPAKTYREHRERMINSKLDARVKQIKDEDDKVFKKPIAPKLKQFKPNQENSRNSSIAKSHQKSTSTIVVATPKSAVEEGEDKVIMHLRKDRKRPQSDVMCTQTEDLTQFPLLELWPSAGSSSPDHQRSGRNYRKRKADSHDRGYSRSRSKSPSRPVARKQKNSSNSYSQNRNKSLSSSASTSSSESDATRYRRSRSRSSSRSSITSSNTSASSASSYRTKKKSNGYRSNSRPKYSSSHSSYRSQPTHRNGVVPKRSASRERRTIYVGHLEHGCSRDDLKNKFMCYGEIKNITFHFKTEQNDTKIKYGFITFDKPENAYSALDCSKKDLTMAKYDINFGGRREFCQQTYADLDNTSQEYQAQCSAPPVSNSNSKDLSFEELLSITKQKIGTTKKIRLT